MVAECEVEVLESSPDTLGGSGYSFASNASALLSQTFDAFHRVRRFKQEPRHQAPFSAVLSQQSHCLADLLKVSRHPGEAPMRAVRPATRSGLGLLRGQPFTGLGASKSRGTAALSRTVGLPCQYTSRERLPHPLGTRLAGPQRRDLESLPVQVFALRRGVCPCVLP